MARWGFHETNLLKMFYGTMKVEDLIVKYFPNRTPQQIYNKVHRLQKSGYKFKEQK